MIKLQNFQPTPLLCRIAGRVDTLPGCTEDGPGELLLDDFKESDGTVITAKAQLAKHLSDHDIYRDQLKSVELAPARRGADKVEQKARQESKKA